MVWSDRNLASSCPTTMGTASGGTNWPAARTIPKPTTFMSMPAIPASSHRAGAGSQGSIGSELRRGTAGKEVEILHGPEKTPAPILRSRPKNGLAADIFP